MKGLHYACKTAILHSQSDLELHVMLAIDPFSTDVHLVPLGDSSGGRGVGQVEGVYLLLEGYWIKAIAFHPTGWTYVTHILPPYSFP